MNKKDILITSLEQQEIQYEIIEHHKQLHSAQEGAEYFGITIGQTAPTLILKTEKGYYTLIISGDHGKVDFTTLRRLLTVEQVKLASPQDVEEVTGSKIGSVSLINQELPTILDRKLYRYDFIYGGTGHPQTTLKIRPHDLEKLNEIVGYIE